MSDNAFIYKKWFDGDSTNIMKDDKVNILFPVEIINRELDFRLFLACMLIKRSNRIFIGQHDAIFRLSGYMKGGIYAGKNIFRELWPNVDLSRYSQIKKNGFIFVHLDEEGGVCPGLEKNWTDLLRRRLDPGCLHEEDHICAWGDFQRDFYRSLNPKCAKNITTTGHPKFEIYKRPYRECFKEEAENIKSRFGDFILINTNFGTTNHKLGLCGIFTELRDVFSLDIAHAEDSAQNRTICINEWVYSSQIFANFIKLINLISLKFPDKAIVVRPHPSEDQNVYKVIFNNAKNIHIIHEGGVAPWLLACSVMIHDGCTTAVEAFFLGTNVINYKSVINPRYDMFLPNEIGAKCFSEEDVLKLISHVYASGDGYHISTKLSKEARALLFNFDSDALNNTIKVIERAEEKLEKDGMAFNRPKYLISEIYYGVIAHCKNYIRPIFKEKQARFKFFSGHTMFPGFDKGKIITRLEKIQKILGVKVKITFYNNELFSIEKE